MLGSAGPRGPHPVLAFALTPTATSALIPQPVTGLASSLPSPHRPLHASSPDPLPLSLSPIIPPLPCPNLHFQPCSPNYVPNLPIPKSCPYSSSLPTAPVSSRSFQSSANFYEVRMGGHRKSDTRPASRERAEVKL